MAQLGDGMHAITPARHGGWKLAPTGQIWVQDPWNLSTVGPDPGSAAAPKKLIPQGGWRGAGALIETSLSDRLPGEFTARQHKQPEPTSSCPPFPPPAQQRQLKIKVLTGRRTFLG